MSKKLFLLDGHALVYRAHYAFINRPLINSKGLNTSAITGFVRSLWDIIKNQNPTHIAVAFDPKGKVFRHEEFPAYKANRDKTPEDIITALPIIKEIVEGFNIPIIIRPNYEADDVIGTIAKQAEKEGFDVYMMTPDKDYAQLVSDKVFMYKPARSGNGVEILGEKEVLEKWDIARVDQVIDILGLQGDSVDNIPGIPGIGAKTAVKLLKEYDTIEGLIANADKLKGKQKEKVIEFAEQGLLSKKLATIDLNVPITFNAEEYQLSEVNKPVLSELFKELEFRSLAKSILGEGPQVAVQQSLFGDIPVAKEKRKSAQASYTVVANNMDNSPHNYHFVNDNSSREALISALKKQKEFSFDTETTSLDSHQANLVGISFSWKDEEAYYVPVPQDREKALALVKEFKEILENPETIKIGQNIKYDMNVLKWYHINVGGELFDTMIAHYLLEPDQRHKLDYLSESYLEYKMVPIESIIGKRGKNQMNMRDIAPEKVSDYAAEDADITYRIKSIFVPKIKEEGLQNLFEKIEMPLVQVLSAMEFEGVNVDGEFLNKYSVKLGEEIVKREREIYKKAGVRFNIASPKQVGEVLFDRLKIPYRWRKTASGQYSTNVDKLNELAYNHDIVQDILDFRKFSKLKSTYVDALPRMINPRTGRVHTSYNQARAATGRLSSENPNLQNIPIKNEEGREIRKAFVPRDENHVLLAADYSQIELRLIAEISEEKAMLEAFQQGVDIHTATAAAVYNVDIDDVTTDQRRNAKTVNFSIIYGAGATNLSRQLGLKRSEAQALIDRYFEQYHGLKSYMDDTKEFARENGYVATLLGRKRTLRDINSQNGLSRSNAERMAVNTPIQGTAADMIKVAMIRIQDIFQERGFKTKMIMQVHDELVFDVPKGELEIVKPIIEEEMKNAIPNLKVPILVGIGVGNNWLEAH